jgi:UDP-N-acetylmuramate dehydrogenase
MERATGAVHQLDPAACGFSYRDSAFKSVWQERYAITAVTFRLQPGGPARVRYGELARTLGAHDGGASPTLDATRSAVLGLRRAKSMVYDTTDPNHRSAGSFFTNPIVSVAHAHSLLQADAAMPVFDAHPGTKKLSAGWLIERAGFARGWKQGRVGLSTHHALALVNHGDATAHELIQAAALIRRTVHARFQVALAAEPVLMGFAAPTALSEPLL